MGIALERVSGTSGRIRGSVHTILIDIALINGGTAQASAINAIVVVAHTLSCPANHLASSNLVGIAGAERVTIILASAWIFEARGNLHGNDKIGIIAFGTSSSNRQRGSTRAYWRAITVLSPDTDGGEGVCSSCSSSRSGNLGAVDCNRELVRESVSALKITTSVAGTSLQIGTPNNRFGIAVAGSGRDGCSIIGRKQAQIITVRISREHKLDEARSRSCLGGA